MEDTLKYGTMAPIVRLYLAAPWSDREYVNELAVCLERIHGVKVVSTWHEPKNEEKAERLAAEQCLREICNADALVLKTHDTESADWCHLSGGRHFETGYALALGKMIIVVGEKGNVFHSLRQVLVVPDVPALKTLLEFRCGMTGGEA